MSKKIEYMDLKVPVFVNKRNNQVSITLPRKNFGSGKNVPKSLCIKIPKNVKW